MKDHARSDEFNYTLDQKVSLQSAEILVVDFDSAERRITLQ